MRRKFIFVFTSLRGAMDRQSRFVCLAEACESIFMVSDSENEPLGDLEELREDDDVDDDGVGGDKLLTSMTIYLSSLTNGKINLS